MSLKSLSSKLYLAIAALAVVLWIFRVPGGTIATVVLVAFMMTMHAGGHGGHGGHGNSTPHADAEEGTHHPEQGTRGDGKLKLSQQSSPDRADPPQPRSSCD